VDRLSEITSGMEFDPNEVPQPTTRSDNEIAMHMSLYEPIKADLATIQQNVIQIDKLKTEFNLVIDDKIAKQTLEKLMNQSTALGHKIKRALEDIKKSNTDYQSKNKDSAHFQMRSNLYQTNIRRFHQVMNDYKGVSHDFKQMLQLRTKRQLKIVDRDISDAAIDKIVESGRAQDVIRQALMTENLQAAVHEIEERHLDILKLEEQVLEVYELFKDLATLVDLQQESLDVIDNRISSAKNYTETAEKELISAEKYQTSSRKKKCCLMVILLIIVIVILVPTLTSALGKA